MKRALVGFCLVGLFASIAFAREKVAAPVFPEGYERWPNVFERTLDLDYKNHFSIKFWVLKYNAEKSV